MTTRRLPAYPLFTHDPTFSVWSNSDHLAHNWPVHCTGYIRGCCMMVRVNGKAYALMGPCTTLVAEQISRTVLPTRTVYVFRCDGVEVTLTFLSPLLPDDLDVLSRPLSYVTASARSHDGHRHHVEVYLDIGGEWAVDTGDQPVVWHRQRVRGLEAMRIGSADQHVLNRSGDNLRTDWGWCWLVVASDGRQQTAICEGPVIRAAWEATGRLPEEDDLRMPRGAFHNSPKMAIAVDLGQVGDASIETTLVIAWEDIFAVEWLYRRCRPYWQRDHRSFDVMLTDSWSRLAELRTRCAAFDKDLLDRCEAAGGKDYRDLCAAAYRQAIAAHKLSADADGSPLFFSKEIFSNACIATVDVTYPSAPLFLLVNPDLLAAMVTPVLQYASSPRWHHPYAPHDLGTYPLANGQVYGGGEVSDRDQMPVEECGNMLVLVTAICRAKGSVDYARPYWRVLTQWANYLMAKGVDPENQLCTDDFAGHIAHNTNLSLKAITGLGCAARLAEQLGDENLSHTWRAAAEGMVTEWMRLAENGGHYRRTFDCPDTWSQKYNLIWDSLLELKLFPPAVAKREVAWYLTQLRPYGLPLDSRKTYTKVDWILWTATLAERDADFQALLKPVMHWLENAPERVPMTDWYDTITGKQQGFQARSVVGGFFIKALKAAWA